MSTNPAQEWRPSCNPWSIAVAVMLATFLEVLDTSVANVALPHIAGNLSASTEESTWVLTSYLVFNAIILAATGWLSRFFGRKRFLLACIFLFTFSSAVCGAATSLGMLVVARILQGAGGGALQPISQAVLVRVSRRGQLGPGPLPHRVSREAIRSALRRLGVSWQRAKHWITSPDPADARKKKRATA